MYRQASITVLLVGLITAGHPFVLHAQLSKEQEEANRQKWQSHIVAIKGAETPSEIPYGERMLMAFREFEHTLAHTGLDAFRGELSAKYGGTPADLVIFSRAVGNNAAFVEGVSQQDARELALVCTEVANSGSELTALEIAQRLHALKTRRLRALETHYATVMQSLGNQMRARLMSDIDTRLVPQMTYGNTDDIGLAHDFPGAYPRIMKTDCSRWLARQKN